jgi:hypothetical protein
MPATRTKSLGTKVSEGEYATIAALVSRHSLESDLAPKMEVRGAPAYEADDHLDSGF